MREYGAGALVAIAVLAGAAIALGRPQPAPLAVWGAVAGGAFAIAGTAYARRRSASAVFAGTVTGVTAAMLVSGTALAVGLAGTAVLARLALPGPGRRRIARNAATALLVALPLLYGAIAVGRPLAGLVPWILGAWLLLVRSLALEPGDSMTRWAAVVLAIGLVPASLLAPAHAGYGGAYFIIALFAQLAVLAAATRLIVGRTDGLEILLKGAMVVGLVALVAGRVG